jgi:protein O-mannosyl-transferase
MRDWAKQKNPSRGRLAARPSSQAQSELIKSGIVCIFLATIVWIVFGQTLRHDFINYDDNEYVCENPRIVSGLSLDGIQWAFSHVHAGNWHPLTTISHMLDCQLYGLQPWGHHMTNVLLHVLAAVFLFLALRRLTGALWPCAVVASVFAIHPLRVESVAWISERKDVLSGVFFMLILLAYAGYARSNRPSPGRYTVVVVLFALGLTCKPTLVTLPFVLLLLDYWPLQRLAMPSSISKIRCSAHSHPAGRRDKISASRTPLPKKPVEYLFVEKIPFFVLSAASCVATLLAEERAVITLRQLTFGDRLANAVVSYVAYLGQMIWPAGLAVVYPFPQGGWNIIQTILALLVLLLISVVFFTWRVKYPFLLVGWLWFLGMLVPMIGIVQVGMQIRADRYTYLSEIGLYLLVTWGAIEVFSKWRRGREVSIALALLIVTGLMADAYSQTSFWRDSETLWNRALANTSNNYVAKTHLADVLVKKGRLNEAISHLREALKISDYPTAHYNLGYALASKDNWADAIASFRAAIRVRPNYPQAHSNLAVSLSKMGRTEEALAEFREAVRLDENYRDAHCNLAILMLQLGRRDEAVAHFREALRLKPDDMAVRDQLRQLGAEK